MVMLHLRHIIIVSLFSVATLQEGKGQVDQAGHNHPDHGHPFPSLKLLLSASFREVETYRPQIFWRVVERIDGVPFVHVAKTLGFVDVGKKRISTRAAAGIIRISRRVERVRFASTAKTPESVARTYGVVAVIQVLAVLGLLHTETTFRR